MLNGHLDFIAKSKANVCVLSYWVEAFCARSDSHLSQNRGLSNAHAGRQFARAHFLCRHIFSSAC
eukprot:SAG11_NODE_18239_length_496_cov_1.423174_1_plen_64_part_01